MLMVSRKVAEDIGAAYDHWHRTEKDRGRPYNFTTAAQLLDDFWKEVKKTLDEKGIRHDL
jgi:hypothetical protein